MTKKAVALFSGGLDSAVLLWLMADGNGYDKIHLINVNYEQRNRREMEAAYNLVARASDRFPDVDIKYSPILIVGLGRLLTENALTGTLAVPQAHYADLVTKATVVPVRNAIFLSLAWSVAINDGAVCVAAAMYAEGDDKTLFADTTPSFVRDMETALVAGSTTAEKPFGPWMNTPFMHQTKKDVVRAGIKLKVPMQLSWSCYNDGVVHCGKCPACVKRKEAFRLATVEDPTDYVA
jgi:7-cyano-7-deazaguanine synthase